MGLIGYEASLFYLRKGYKVIGIDNDLRGKMFGIKTKYQKKLSFLMDNFPKTYIHYPDDIRNNKIIKEIFKTYGKEIKGIIHTAAQTSHDYSAKDPSLDFSINADATLNLLEVYRSYTPQAVFIFTSTNKVYGDKVNSLPFKDYGTRFDLKKDDRYFNGIDEDFFLDQSTHSIFGVSKLSADSLVQEYGRYFNLQTGIFRLGVVAGGGQSGALEQGFLSFMIGKLINNETFLVIGYKGKQVRDIIHAKDVVLAMDLFFKKPIKGGVFNLGGGRENSASLIEVIDKLQSLAKRKLKVTYQNKIRVGDHKWWITDFSKFKTYFPSWKISHTLNQIILEIYKSYNDNPKV